MFNVVCIVWQYAIINFKIVNYTKCVFNVVNVLFTIKVYTHLTCIVITKRQWSPTTFTDRLKYSLLLFLDEYRF